MVDFSRLLLRAFLPLEDLIEARKAGAVVVGVGGSRFGATPAQRRALSTLLRAWGTNVVIQGDCVGVDEMAHDMALRLGMASCTFPSDVEQYRAHTERRGAIQLAAPMHPLTRNDHVTRWDAFVALSRKTPLVVVDERGRAVERQLRGLWRY